MAYSDSNRKSKYADHEAAVYEVSPLFEALQNIRGADGDEDGEEPGRGQCEAHPVAEQDFGQVDPANGVSY